MTVSLLGWLRFLPPFNSDRCSPPSIFTADKGFELARILVRQSANSFGPSVTLELAIFAVGPVDDDGEFTCHSAIHRGKCSLEARSEIDRERREVQLGNRPYFSVSYLYSTRLGL